MCLFARGAGIGSEECSVCLLLTKQGAGIETQRSRGGDFVTWTLTQTRRPAARHDFGFHKL